MKFAKLAFLATAMAATPIAATAQDPGTTIFSQVDGTEVGVVETNDGATVLVDTGTYKAPLPSNLLAEREGQWTINATKAQIDGMMKAQEEAANAKRDAALVAGAAVMSADGMPAGVIYTVDDADTAIVKSDAGIITLTRESFAVDANGNLMALYSAEQLTANTVAVPEGAEIMTPAQAAAREVDAEAEATADAGAEGETNATM